MLEDEDVAEEEVKVEHFRVIGNRQLLLLLESKVGSVAGLSRRAAFSVRLN